MQKWIRVLVYLFFIVAFIFLSENLISKAEHYSAISYSKNLYHLAIIFINIIFGALLGMEYIINEKRKKGAWKINFPKFVILFLPALLFNLYFIALVFNAAWIQNLNFLYRAVVATNIISTIFGYSIMTILKKE
ncbi:hypothetical protein DFR58_10489 [Anaerobacterium chartisolvens]|uniref:Uncharacterized protein n=1 Tax=Anaerobacterium chartisolvens TaxID=1297424 RepID=A0A369BBB4_9FIRM|nr:hypothetical protein [Anaerobacterium chartisolvens]RCX18820.1 hypothetical protein DFR58_10489 [Anaerobacterium chartisolvens]